MLKFLRDFLPDGFCDFSYVGRIELTFNYFSKEMISILRADGNEIGSVAIIPPPGTRCGYPVPPTEFFRHCSTGCWYKYRVFDIWDVINCMYFNIIIR